jgi:hypothetical protein
MSGGGGVDRLGDRLRAVPVPDEDGARDRAVRVLAAAFEERPPAPAPSFTRTSRRLAPALAVAGVLALVVLALTPPGQAVSDWLRDRLGRDHVRVAMRPALDRLPSTGSLLVQSPEGPWVVRSDGSKRLLGPYREGTWSPQARFVAVTRPDELLAVEPGGRVHWSLARQGVRRPRWSPSGFRVAYLARSGVRVVAGDGTGDRALGTGVAAEWRPLSVSVVGGQKVLPNANVLAVARRSGGVRLVDVDTRLPLWHARVGGLGVVRGLSWSGDGARVLVATARAVSVLDQFGRLSRRIALPGGATLADARFAPSGRRIAMIRRRGTASELVLLDGGRSRLLFAGAGRLDGLTWSPDGRWLLVSWPDADQFVFVRTDGGLARVTAAQGVANEFDPRTKTPAAAPLPSGWCCSQ